MKGLPLFLLTLLFLFGLVPSRAQELEELFSQDLEDYKFKDAFKGMFLGNKDTHPFDISGNIGLSSRSYGAFNATDRQSPFTWSLSSNINISIYKIKFPFSFLISAENQVYAHPFRRETIDNLKDRRYTRIGVSPYYKWIKLHAGHRSMNFSPFTVANRTFLGGGVELTPGNMRFAAFYGGMAKTDPQDRSLFGFNREVFDQKGLGFKVGYGKGQDFIDVIFFRARDDKSTGQAINEDSLTVFPNENAVLGVNAQWTIAKRIQLKFELASSGFTQNAADPTTDEAKFPFPNFVLDRRTSTVYRKAINAGVDYLGESFNIGLGYKRIEPEYRTLGAYFFNNDLEDYTLNFGFNVANGRMRVNGYGGIQRNNLFGDQSSQFLRTIASLNAGYYHNSFSVSLDYSNNTSDIDYILNPELDSLTAIVITQNLGLSANYTIAKEEKNSRHTLALNFSYQTVNDKLEDPMASAGSQLITTVFSHTLSTRETGWKFNSRVSYTRSELSMLLLNRMGLGFGLSKTLVKDIWSMSIQTNYFFSSGQATNNNTFNLRWNSPIRINEDHRIDVGMLYLTRTGAGDNGSNFHELTGTIGYVYSFGMNHDRKDKKSKSKTDLDE